MSVEIDTAMVLAAGLGKRMRPLTDTMPKPMVPLAGRPLVDHTLDRLADSGIKRAVVNVHYKAEVLEAHLAARQSANRGPEVSISDERGLLLETGGGVVKALPLIGGRPFLICNSDTTWVETGVRNLERLIAGWDAARMDSLMLLAEKDRSLGYSGGGDFRLGADGCLTRRGAGETAPYVFTGVSIARPSMFDDAPQGRFSLNIVWDRAISLGRLHGLVLDGWWMHVGTPPALVDAERFIAELNAPIE
jgi:MurNAc alpha-1-phosphate uridylyltransferase